MIGPSAPGPHPLPAFLALLCQATAGDPAKLRAAIRGLDRYQAAPRRPNAGLGQVVGRRGGTTLRHLAGPRQGRPVVLLPSIINGPEILHLGAEKSLAAHLGDKGFQVLLIDWGAMEGAGRRLSLAGLVTQRVLPLLRQVGQPVTLMGYCLGGTLALAAAAVGDPGLVARLALLATPWHFEGYGAERRARAVAAWQALAPIAHGLGGLPLSLLNPLFWSLDQEGVVAKFARLGTLTEGDPAIDDFVLVEDWAGGGPPVGPAAARDLFELGFARDSIGRGQWRVAGQPVRPDALGIPILEIGASRDRLVPDAARIRCDCATTMTIDAGHVGMVVGRARHTLWDALSNFAESA
jgi:polyhydroxyalkanoate synthase